MEVMYPRCAGLDVHSRCVNGCLRIAAGRKATTEHREFATTTAGLLELSAWLSEAGCTHVAMEATGVYWKPVWHILEESFTLVLATPAAFPPRPGADGPLGAGRRARGGPVASPSTRTPDDTALRPTSAAGHAQHRRAGLRPRPRTWVHPSESVPRAAPPLTSYRSVRYASHHQRESWMINPDSRRRRTSWIQSH